MATVETPALKAASPSPPVLPSKRDHSPSVSSPLNPDPAARSKAPRPPPRETREKKESLKKRESTIGTRGNTPDAGSKLKHSVFPNTPSPLRYGILQPKPSDYESPRDPLFMSHEPEPWFVPSSNAELRKPVDHAENKKAYRYTPCVADATFPHLKYYRQVDLRPYGARMSFEDSDRLIHYDPTGTILTNEKGWRMARANVVAREGRYYYEVKILRGVPREGPAVVNVDADGPQPHIRMGWARREAPLDAPVGFDAYSYGVTDIRFETIHRSRPVKFQESKSKAGQKSTNNAAKAPNASARASHADLQIDDHVREGDVVGLEIELPSLSLHRKIVEGNYNPAVDVTSGFDDLSTHDIIRDRIQVPYKGNNYFEQYEYQSTKPMEQYGDRGPPKKSETRPEPGPNHEEPALRSLPYSSIKIYKNGVLKGTAFKNLMSFLPPASTPAPSAGARPGFDDGMLGYFPAVAAFAGGVAAVNFGPDFWCPPSSYARTDVKMEGNDEYEDMLKPWAALQAMSVRFKEQIAEDILYDIIDEADFFAQDGGYSGNVGTQSNTVLIASGLANLREE